LVGADPTNKTVVHPLRWPGSWHRKAEPPRLCRIERCDPDVEIDLDEALAALKAAVGALPPEDKPEPAEPATHDDSHTWESLIRGIISGKAYHPSIAPLTAKLRVGGLDKGTIINLTRGIMKNTIVPRDKRWQDRYDHIPHEVKTAWAKFSGPQQALFDPWAKYRLPEFPFEILPSVAQQFAETESVLVGCDPSAMAMAELAAFSGALDHRFAMRMMRHGKWAEAPRLWVLLVGDPSTKKTPIFNAATQPIMEHQDYLWRQYEARVQEYTEAKARGEDVEEPDPPERLITTDITVEKAGEILGRSERGILVKRDEIAGWIGSMDKYTKGRGSAVDRGFWLQAFDGGPHIVDRIGRGENFIHNLSVTFLGGIQPERLTELHGLTTDGLLQRFLPVMMGPPSPAEDKPNNDVAYDALVRSLLLAKPERLILDDDALAAMHALRQEIYNLEMASAGVVEGFPTFVGKLPGYAGRLALILHMIADPKNGATSAVVPATVESVRRLVMKFIVPHALVFYRAAESAAAGDRLKRIGSWLLTSGKRRIVASDLMANVRECRGLDVGEIGKRLSPFVAGGWLEPVEPSPWCRSWDVNPALAVTFAGRRRVEAERKTAFRATMEQAFEVRHAKKNTSKMGND
jgi:hypothetical protein